MKFSIRDLFWLVLLAACCTLWWMDRVRLDRLQRQEAERNQQTMQMLQFLNSSLQTPTPGPNWGVPGPATPLRDDEAGEPNNPDRPADMLLRPLFFPAPNLEELSPQVEPGASESKGPTRNG